MGLRFGRYETLRELAAGGMATVYLGRAVGEGGFERLVAIKVMHPHLAHDEEFVSMFLDEARLAARIRHPNVVATIDVQKSAEGMFLVMDYVEGASLQEIRKYLKKNNELPPLGIALRVMLDALTGLHDAHELVGSDGELLHLVHRDVSPQNILVGKDGVSRLTDFGVARASARLSSTRGGQLKGKLSYMPPEQIMAEAVDRRSDVYSAGVVLWEALVGKRLFRAKSDGELVHKILAGTHEAPHEKNDRVPELISAACMRALSLHRNERYPTAAAFADELEDAARQTGIPVASSRSVSTFMKSILPALELSRPTDVALTPPSGLGQFSAPKSVPLPMGSSPAAVTAGLSSPSAPAASSLTHTEAVMSHAPRQRLRSGATVLAVGALLAVAGIGAFVMVTRDGASSAVEPTAAPASPAATAAPASPDATREPAETAAGGAAPAATSAEPSDTSAPEDTAEPIASTTPPPPRLPRPGGISRPKPKPKGGLTDYDPDEL